MDKLSATKQVDRKPITARMFVTSFWISVVAGLFVYGALWIWAMQYAPPSGHVFERLPVLEGDYGYKESGLRKVSAKTYVSDVRIYCGSIGFFSFVDYPCEFEFRNPEKITVVRAFVPTVMGLKPVVVKLSVWTSNYVQLGDALVRAKWLSNTRFFCICYSFFLGFLLTLLLQLWYRLGKPGTNTSLDGEFGDGFDFSGD